MEQPDNPPTGTEPARILRELWRTKQSPSSGQLLRILGHLSNAAFGSAAQSASAHLSKRIHEDGEWHDSTTAAQYLADLQSVFGRPDAGLYLFERRGGLMLLGVVSTGSVIDQARKGPRSKNLLAVFYSVDRGRMVSGYQIQTVIKRGIPEDGLWLRR